MIEQAVNAIAALWQTGEMAQALAAAEVLAQEQPHYPNVIAILACARANVGDKDAAQATFLHAAHMYCQVADSAGAGECWRLALQLRGCEHGPGWQALGEEIEAQGQPEVAEALYRQGWNRYPDQTNLLIHLARLLETTHRADDAIALYEQALIHQPNMLELRFNLARLYMSCDRHDRATEHFKSIDLTSLADPLQRLILKKIAVCRALGPVGTQGEINQAVARFVAAEKAALTLSPTLPASSRGTGPLRIGWCSASLGLGLLQDRLMQQLVPAMEQHGIESPIYVIDGHSTAAVPPIWRDLRNIPPHEVANKMRSDNLDALITLDFAPMFDPLPYLYRPAPLIVSLLHGFASFGGCIDIILTDPQLIPPNDQPLFGEKILYLAGGGTIVLEEGSVPSLSSPPCLERGYVTFGSFNRPSKLSDDTFALWAELLHRLPTTRLHLQSGQFSPVTERWVRNKFAEHSITDDRITIVGWTPLAEFLAAYRTIDIALDPLHFSGGITTVQALCHGVPVVTCPGNGFNSHIAASVLTSTGHTEWCAQDQADWLRIATNLAEHPQTLIQLRGDLYRCVQNSRLLDPNRIATSIIEALTPLLRKPITPAGATTAAATPTRPA